MPETISPVPPSRRSIALDIARGFGLFGILIANMAAFSEPIYQMLLPGDPFPGAVDQGARWVAFALFQGKFFALFGMLFAVGVVIQRERAGLRGTPFLPRYLRRMAVLLVFGLAHLFLLWFGDVLVLYTILGLLLLPFLRVPDRWVLTVAVLLVLVPIVFHWRSTLTAPPATEEGTAAVVAYVQGLADQAVQSYGAGTWSDAFQQRLADLSFSATSWFVLTGPLCFATFLVGLVFGRRRWLRDAPEPVLRRLTLWGGVVGLGGNALAVLAMQWATPPNPTVVESVGFTLFAVGSPALCVFYVAGLTRLVQRPEWARRLRPLAAAGRMSLTLYLLQSVILTTVFYGYGLGAFGKVGPALQIVLGLVVFAVQVAAAVWWMERFRFGPLEWLWRSMTYGSLQPLRKLSETKPTAPHPVTAALDGTADSGLESSRGDR